MRRSAVAVLLACGWLPAAACSDDAEPGVARDAVARPAVDEATRMASDVRNRFRLRTPGGSVSMVGPDAVRGFIRSGDRLAPVADAGATVRVDFARDRPADFVLVDVKNEIHIRVVLLDVEPSVAEIAGGLLVHRGGGGRDVLIRPMPHGVEDFLVLPAAGEPVVRYRLELLEGVLGLRLVDHQLELLDAGGAPRLRMRRPELVDAHGTLHPARVAIEGCRVDGDLRAPWGRAVTDPGAPACVVRVEWSPGPVVLPALLDPAWSTTGSMSTPRQNHTASLLDTGKVLVAGGEASTLYSTAELYDPATRTFAATGAMSAARTSHTATTLDDGRILVVGGGLAPTQSTAETYDASSGDWTLTGALAAPHSGHVALRFDDDTVLVAGSNIQPVVELFDPSTGSNGTWSTVAPWVTPRLQPAGAVLDDGRALIIAGQGPSGILSTTEIYDPTGDAWAPGPNLSYPRREPAAVKVSDGRVFVFGSSTQVDGASANAEMITLTSTTVSISTTLNIDSEYRWPNLTLLDDGNLLVADDSLLGVASGAWTRIASPSTFVTGFRSFTVTKLPDGGALKVGGFDGNSALGGAEIYGLLIDGELCQSASDCRSGFCVDQVCCDTACDAPCFSCSALHGSSGATGTCAPVAQGEYDASCVRTDPNDVCGVNGTCDGLGACDFEISTTACGTRPCADDTTAYAMDHCDGAGTCSPTATTIDCSPLTCQGTACLTRCSRDEDCVDGTFCNAPSGTCDTSLADGTPCERDEACASSLCVDGVCCDSECAGTCRSCNGRETGGADGACLPVTAGSDPGGECADSGARCETDGMCDGAGACRTYTKDAEGVCELNGCGSDDDCDGFCVQGFCCDSQCDGQCESCLGEERGIRQTGLCGAVRTDTDPHGDCKNDTGAESCTSPLVCSATRTCVCADRQAACVGDVLVGADQQETNCAPYACDPAARLCKTECTSSDDCAAGAVCDPTRGNGVCEVPAPAASDEGGCGCRVGGGRPSHVTAVGLAFLSLARRRKARRQS